jgi:hypothetical protein
MDIGKGRQKGQAVAVQLLDSAGEGIRIDSRGDLGKASVLNQYIPGFAFQADVLNKQIHDIGDSRENQGEKPDKLCERKNQRSTWAHAEKPDAQNLKYEF